MNKILIAVLFLMTLFTANLFASTTTKLETSTSSIEGGWSGELDLGVMKITLILHVHQNEIGDLNATVDCPEQQLKDFPVDSISFKEEILKFEIKTLMASFEGQLNTEVNEISGRFVQGGMSLPLIFKKGIASVETWKRPQEPMPPYPYLEEEVSYENKAAGVTLAGALTMPKTNGPFPAVILITGSGAHDRNETLLGHKPFLVLADYLTRQGIAVLRVDDRGVAKSTGDFHAATDADFATDVLAGLEYLKTRKEINSSQIGLIGHSCGALIAPMVAAQSPDVAFVVMLAGPGMNGEKIIYEQGALIARAEGASEEAITKERQIQEQIFAILKKESNLEKADAQLRAMMTKQYNEIPSDQKDVNDQKIDAIVKKVNTPWFRHFITFEPVSALRQVKVPVLVLNGELDLQVPPKQNLPLIEKALVEADNKDYTIIELPKQNHLFQTSQTGALSEYAKIEETISPSTLKIISEWIRERTMKSSTEATHE